MAIQFPPKFLWGSATASYQIEGAAHADGRGLSIWDTFSHTPGKVINGDTGDVACDHYHRYQEDVALMADLGLQAYRFSVAWPRIFPEGTGTINQAGLDFYSRLVDELLEHGITPNLTLYHWDLPQALQDQGGWENRAVIDAFVRYADVVSRHLGDRVPTWTTFNEPWVVAAVGYGFGAHAPGLTNPLAALQVGHHLLIAHGQAVQALRANGVQQVGIVLNLAHVDPASDSPEDAAAAQRWDGFQNRWLLDPLFKGGYPADLFTLLPPPQQEPGDQAIIATPIDYLGVNYYSRSVIEASDEGFFGSRQISVPGSPVTAMDWEIYPHGLFQLLTRLSREYTQLPLYITENGAAFDDQVVDGQVHDEDRRAYLQGHFEAAQQAIAEGVNLRGYFVWSLLDNFEWAYGYSKRFGIIYVDYATQQRIPKDSALWYKQVIQANGLR